MRGAKIAKPTKTIIIKIPNFAVSGALLSSIFSLVKVERVSRIEPTSPAAEYVLESL